MAIEFAERIRRIPAYPAAGGYARRGAAGAPGQQRVAVPAAAGRARGDRRARSATLNRYPDPVQLAPAPAPQRPLRRARRRGSRSATARATSCWPPARRCSSRAPSSSTRGRPSPSTRTSRAASGARAIDRRARRATTATTSPAMLREITVATRLVLVCNPNNPTSTALAARGRSPQFLARGAAARVRDPRRGLLRVQPARRPRRLDRAARRATRTSSCCAPSPRSTASAGLRVGFALCGSEELPRALDQVRQPFFCNALAQAAAVEALRHQDAVDRARHPHRRRAHLGRRAACARSGSSRPTRRPTSAGCDLGEERDEADGHATGCASAACSCARGAALGSDGPRCASPTACPRRTRASWTRSPRCWRHGALSAATRQRELPQLGRADSPSLDRARSSATNRRRRP